MKEDHAIIIGLQNYPGLGVPVLTGPEHDAKEFEKWVLSETGGQVPVTNRTLILSSDYPPPFASLLLTKPTELEIVDAFEKLHAISNKNRDDGLGPRVGRRLYIYMSGHGIAPTPLGSTAEESALLTSNVDPKQIKVPRYHIPGDYTATWLCRNEYFDEVFLFMDCCREIATVTFINTLFSPTGTSDKGKKFCAYATKWSRLAKEKSIDGQVQGIFTKTLLLALKGAAAEPDPANPGQGIITFESLESYLLNNMKQFIDPAFQSDSKVQEPVVDYLPVNKTQVVIETPLPKFQVIIQALPGATGEVGVFSNTMKSIIMRIPVNELPKAIELPREEYALFAIVNGSPETIPLPVKGIENVA